MRTKFKVFVCALAAAAALPTCAVASAAIADMMSAEEVSTEIARVDAAKLREDPEWIEAFNEALLEGRSPIDPVHAAIFGLDMTGENDEIMPAYLEQAAPASMDATDVRLTLVHDDQGGNGYNLWSGRFVVDDVKAFAATFTEPYTMDCKVFSGTTAQLAYKNGLSVNYKQLMGQYYYMEGSKRVGNKPKTSEGYGTIGNMVSTYSGSGKLIEKAFYFYMYKGDPTSEYYDVAVIHVVDKNYAGTEEYAALPYGNLIGCYTYVDVNELPEVEFAEN